MDPQMDAINELKSVHRLLLSPSLNNGSRAKTPVVRGARACTVCRAAKVFNLLCDSIFSHVSFR